jgi:hypothetical protein
MDKILEINRKDIHIYKYVKATDINNSLQKPEWKNG